MRGTSEARIAAGATAVVLLLGVLPAVMEGLGVQEPYPALTMPSFGGSPLDGDDVVLPDLSITAIDTDGAEHVVDRGELLQGIPLIGDAVLRSAFSEGLDDDGELVNPRPAPSPLRLVLAGLPGGQTHRGTVRAYDERTREWLRTRFQELLPAVDVVAVRFTTATVRIPVGGPGELGESVERATVQVVTVPMDGG